MGSGTSKASAGGGAALQSAASPGADPQPKGLTAVLSTAFRGSVGKANLRLRHARSGQITVDNWPGTLSLADARVFGLVSGAVEVFRELNCNDTEMQSLSGSTSGIS